MPDGIHSHRFNGRTTYSDGHTHAYSGMTSRNPDLPGHTHIMTGVTTFNDGHTHQYSFETGPGIPAEGGHTHYYHAATSMNEGHVHYMDGYTTIYDSMEYHY